MPPRPYHRLAWLCCFWLVLVPPVYAQHDHTPLSRSDTLDFATLLEHSLHQAPALREDPVRRQEALDWVAAGRSWLAGRPNLNLNYFDDRVLDNRGQRELEYGIQVPLWRPGERGSMRELGRQYQSQVPLWLQALTLELAGQIRTNLADLAEAEALLALEREATAHAEELLRVTTVLYDSGSVPRLDLLQAETLLLEQRRSELAAESQMVDAELAYRLLTGLRERPAAPHAEAQSPLADIAAVEENHPLLRYLHSEIELASATIEQSRIAAKGSPQLGIGSRRERGDHFAPYTDSLNFSLQVPIGGTSHVNAKTTAARRAKVDAEVNYFTARRELERALHDAEHELHTVEQSLPLAEQQANLASQRRDMAETAFAEGEIGLVQLLPAIQEARVASRAFALLRLREQRLIAAYNQTLGVLP